MKIAPTGMSIGALMTDIGRNEYYLPAIQREFVWPPHKIEALFDSLLREYPIGTLLRWKVEGDTIHDFQFYELMSSFDVRKGHNKKADRITKDFCYGVLDGQQRMTALNIGLRGTYTEKLPRKRWSNPDAFETKRLYINLLFRPKGGDDQKFQIKFLTEKRAKDVSDSTCWFLVGDILKYGDKDKLREYRRSSDFAQNDIFEDTLDCLWNAVWNETHIHFYTEVRQELDEVLRIFIRLNSGGVTLSYSDLLFSLLTASWQQHDAREEVFKLVDSINKEYGAEFNFSRDYVLKTLLVCSGGDVRFKTENIRKKAGLETVWIEVQQAIRTTVKLLAGFGFDGSILRAPYASIPIVYHLYTQKHGDGFITGASFEDEREQIRQWVLKILLGQVFRGRTDALLTAIRKEMTESYQQGAVTFPFEAINKRLQGMGSLVFVQETIESIIDEAQYGSPVSVLVLSLITPQLRTDVVSFHVDHLHPKSKFTVSLLRDQGIPENDLSFCMESFNGLPNLQLLEGRENVRKNDELLETWLANPKNQHWKERSMIPEVDLRLANFRKFYDERRKKLVGALRNELSELTSSESQRTAEEDLTTGEVGEE